jgi:predicted aspartyl protease
VISGTVSDDGVPIIMMPVAGRMWPGIIDTGFNGDLELPEALRALLNVRFIGRMSSLLASGQQIEEDVYLVEFPFDGQTVRVEATFVPGSEILIGTQLLRSYWLEINFPQQTVRLEAVP